MQVERSDLQNDFYNNARKAKTTVNIFLNSGKKLVGRIRSFDKFTILLESEMGEQIIYKHAISTVGISHGGSGGRNRNHSKPAREQPTS